MNKIKETNSPAGSNWKFEDWIEGAETDDVMYSDYWNDEEIEKEKEWYILDKEFSEMEAHLNKFELPQDLNNCFSVLKSAFNCELKGTGIDLAAGNLWAAPYLLNNSDVKQLYCLEFSKHRLISMGPKVLEHYNVPKEKIVLVYGSFYNLRLKDNSLDFVFFSQAFHHAEYPEKLLQEIDRVLKPNGIIIIIGEHIISYNKAYIKHAIKYLISTLVPDFIQLKLFKRIFDTKTFFSKSEDLFPPDPITGDHYYTTKEYLSFFSKYNYKVKQLKNNKTQFQSFVLVKLT